LKKLPHLRSKRPLFLTATIADQKFIFVFDESKGTGKGYDTLIADANRDGNLTNEKIYRAKPVEDYSNFYAVRLTLKIDGDVVPYALSVDLDTNWLDDSGSGKRAWFCSLNHVGYYTGKVKMGQQEVRVVAMDYNSNGRYDDGIQMSGGTPIPGTLLFFQRKDKDPFEWFSGFIAIRKSNRIAHDNKFYELRMQPSGRTISLMPFSTPMGTIHASYPQCRILLTSETADFVLDSSDGEFKVPVGVYQFTRMAQNAPLLAAGMNEPPFEQARCLLNGL